MYCHHLDIRTLIFLAKWQDWDCRCLWLWILLEHFHNLILYSKTYCNLLFTILNLLVSIFSPNHPPVEVKNHKVLPINKLSKISNLQIRERPAYNPWVQTSNEVWRGQSCWIQTWTRTKFHAFNSLNQSWILCPELWNVHNSDMNSCILNPSVFHDPDPDTLTLNMCLILWLAPLT